MDLTESQVAALRRAFRLLNRHMLLMWRLGLGRYMAGPRSGYILVLATTGRKSGQRRLAPLDFAEEGTAVYCTAGFGRSTHWLLNLEADPSCELWLPDGRRVAGHAELVTDEATRIRMLRRVLVRAGFATRVAEPGLDPVAAPDDVIAALGARYGHRYEIVEIQLGDPITGPGGPGDLEWVWPAAAVGLACGWLVRRLLDSRCGE
ncbi:MAG: nitroreductase/quinone reductase family protein [Acidimicrobiia bacterium]|nr:nitroreductase/quinone reductase family protein [Acidimicrobiia bacterium]